MGGTLRDTGDDPRVLGVCGLTLADDSTSPYLTPHREAFLSLLADPWGFMLNEFASERAVARAKRWIPSSGNVPAPHIATTDPSGTSRLLVSIATLCSLAVLTSLSYLFIAAFLRWDRYLPGSTSPA